MIAFEVIATTRPPRYTALVHAADDVVLRLRICPTVSDDGIELNRAVRFSARRAVGISGVSTVRAVARRRASKAERRSTTRGATAGDVAALNDGPSDAVFNGSTPRPITVNDVRAPLT